MYIYTVILPNSPLLYTSCTSVFSLFSCFSLSSSSSWASLSCVLTACMHHEYIGRSSDSLPLSLSLSLSLPPPISLLHALPLTSISASVVSWESCFSSKVFSFLFSSGSSSLAVLSRRTSAYHHGDKRGNFYKCKMYTCMCTYTYIHVCAIQIT